MPSSIALYANRFIKEPKEFRNTSVDSSGNKKSKIASKDSEEAAFGTYAGDGGTKFVYRVRKEGASGAYKIVTESTNKVVSREDLLTMRSKKKADRHCY